MKQKLPWFAFYPADFLKDTQHLSHDEIGIYWLLLLAYYNTGKPLPNNDKALANIARCTVRIWTQKRNIILNAFFKLRSGKWHHKRADLEMHKAQIIHKIRLKNMAKARKAKQSIGQSIGQSISQSIAVHSHSHSQVHKERLNDERLNVPARAGAHAGVVRSSINRFEDENRNGLFGRLALILGPDEMERAGGHWRKNWIGPHPALVERGLAELELQLKEGRTIANRAAYLTDLLQRWL